MIGHITINIPEIHGFLSLTVKELQLKFSEMKIITLFRKLTTKTKNRNLSFYNGLTIIHLDKHFHISFLISVESQYKDRLR